MNNDEMKLTLPESIENKEPDYTPAPKNNLKRLLSLPFLKEIFKSNWKSWLIMTIGNSLIVMVIFIVLSTLSINATKDSLTSMFGSANTESTIKSGAIGLYTCYEESIDLYENEGQELATNGPLIYDYTGTVIEKIYDSTTSDGYNSSTKTSINTMVSAYNVAYRIVSGTNDEKHEKAKNVVESSINLTSYTSDEKALIKVFIGYYLDEYYKDNNIDYGTTIEYIINEAINYYGSNTLGLTTEQTKILENHFTKSISDYKESDKTSESIEQIKINNTIETISNFAGDSYKEMITPFATSIINNYITNKDAYTNNTKLDESDTMGYKDKTITDGIKNIIISTMEDIAYLNNLPSFEVKYVTDELGRPVQFIDTGTYDENGKTIYEEKIILDTDPFDSSILTALDKNMGTSSNILQKMHKYSLTGVDYTQEEIDEAKEEAKSSIDLTNDMLQSFLDDYVTLRNDSSQTNIYYSTTKDSDGNEIGTINTENLMEKVSLDLLDMSEDQLKEMYNVDSLDDINLKDTHTTRQALEDMIKNYTYSSIVSFKRQYNSDLKRMETSNWTLTDVMFHSMSVTTVGVIDQLPVFLTTSLSDLKDVNMYGMIIGLVFFSISGLLLPIVYTVQTATNLITTKVENGSLAFTLSTPIRRNSVVFTSAFYLICAEIASYIVLYIFAIISRSIGIALGTKELTTAVPVSDLTLFTFGSLSIMLSLSGISFMASCYCNKTKDTNGIANGVSFFCLICTILGLFGSDVMPSTVRIDAMNIFNYFTIVSLFDVNAVLDRNLQTFFLKLLGLYGITIITYVLGSIKFTKKDLPL